ncbi:MAG: hypothetical protein II198_03225 [Bacteroidaceae bacterium]|nr:hypothetical protein [Bacteroidaceae bacterium]
MEDKLSYGEDLKVIIFLLFLITPCANILWGLIWNDTFVDFSKVLYLSFLVLFVVALFLYRPMLRDRNTEGRDEGKKNSLSVGIRIWLLFSAMFTYVIMVYVLIGVCLINNISFDRTYNAQAKVRRSSRTGDDGDMTYEVRLCCSNGSTTYYRGESYSEYSRFNTLDSVFVQLHDGLLGLPVLVSDDSLFVRNDWESAHSGFPVYVPPATQKKRQSNASDSGKTATVHITGHLTDEHGNAVTNVIVAERDRKGKDINLAITDFDGNFEMYVKDAGNYLTFSSYGHEPQKLLIGSRTVFNVKLKSSVDGK